MELKYVFFIGLLVAVLFSAGCTSTTGPTVTPAMTVPVDTPKTMEPVQSDGIKSWTCTGSTIDAAGGPRSPFMYTQTDPDTPRYQSLPAPQPTPAYTGTTMQNDPIIGTYIFNPGQFDSKVVEKLDYFSELSSPEFYYRVPLDISPDITWTFRDDGVLLFFQNNISSSDTSLRRFWRNSSGYFLRSGTWKVLESENYQTKYQVSWGCTVQGMHNYVITADKNGVTLTQPTVLKMIKSG